jgi:hypothetical protein
LESVKAYQGPYSISVYLNEQEEFKKLTKFWNENKVVQNHVTFHVVFKNKYIENDNPLSRNEYLNNLEYSYPINYLRNVARKYSKTNFIIYLDCDFILSSNFKRFFEKNKLMSIMNKLNNDFKSG